LQRTRPRADEGLEAEVLVEWQPAKVGERDGEATARGKLLPKRKEGCAGREAPERERILDVAAG
jgi:hypothetical protein